MMRRPWALGAILLLGKPGRPAPLEAQPAPASSD